MLKIKDNVNFEGLDLMYKLDTEIISSEYDYDLSRDREHSKNGVFISENEKTIYGIDNSSLDLLYDLIQAGLVEKIDS